jgi:hypothetical protein
MFKLSRFAIAGAGVMLSTLSVQAQERPDYRDFTLGSPLARVLAQVHATSSDVTLVHQRPALIQDLRWRTPYVPGAVASQRDPVQQLVFSFCDDQLFRITIDYDRAQTDGMTDADMIAALSGRYGLASTPSKPPKPASQTVGEWTTTVAQWGEGDAVVALLRRAFTAGFQVVVTSARLEGVARVAADESVRLDLSEAPAREIARQKRDAEDTRLAQEKARAANKAAFRP